MAGPDGYIAQDQDGKLRASSIVPLVTILSSLADFHHHKTFGNHGPDCVNACTAERSVLPRPPSLLGGDHPSLHTHSNSIPGYNSSRLEQ